MFAFVSFILYSLFFFFILFLYFFSLFFSFFSAAFLLTRAFVFKNWSRLFFENGPLLFAEGVVYSFFAFACPYFFKGGGLPETKRLDMIYSEVEKVNDKLG